VYEAEISRENPSCFIFLLDQSGSMKDPIGGDPGQRKRKADGVADAVNRLLYNLTILCTREEGVRHYYDIGIVGYGGPTNGPILGGALAGRDLVPIGEVADNPLRVETRQKDDGAGGVVTVDFPVWFDAVANAGTPMCAGLRQAQAILQPWVATHPSAYPPIVINLTDGEATDGDPIGPAQALKQLATDDGNVLVFNCHISSAMGTPVVFPEEETGLPPDAYARQLFQMSSVLPQTLREAAKSTGFAVGSQARGFAFNAELVDVIRFLDVGTRSATQLR
jgi:hypothetical protein